MGILQLCETLLNSTTRCVCTGDNVPFVVTDTNITRADGTSGGGDAVDPPMDVTRRATRAAAVSGGVRVCQPESFVGAVRTLVAVMGGQRTAYDLVYTEHFNDRFYYRERTPPR